MCNVNRVSTSNPWEPIKVDIVPDRFTIIEDDSNWPTVKRQPTNNKPGPKKINPEKALPAPKKKRAWKQVQMVDRTKPESPKEQIIAGVTKTQTVEARETTIKEVMISPVEQVRTSMCQMECHVTDATKFLAP